MFSKIYLHRATRSIELMLCDVLREADAQLGGWLRNAIHDAPSYSHLTDNRVLGRIESYDADGRLDGAKGILKRIYSRKLYRFVDEQLVPTDYTNANLKFTPEAIAGLNPDQNINLRPEDICVHDLKLGERSDRRVAQANA